MNLEEKKITIRKLQSDDNSVICSKEIDEETTLPKVVTQEAYITSEESVEDYEERTIGEMLDEINTGIKTLENPPQTYSLREPSKEEQEQQKFILDRYKELKHRLEEMML